jgi:molybdenum cofactor cytidylyltransferase
VSDRLIVVLGSHYEQIKASIVNQKCEIIENKNWPMGMSTSIITGLESALQSEKVIISICDQPYLNAAIFQKLIAKSEVSDKNIIASDYGSQIGVPILFKKSLFTELMKLEGSTGAKSILQNFKNDIDTISFERGDFDIDTIGDWQRYLEDNKKA